MLGPASKDKVSTIIIGRLGKGKPEESPSNEVDELSIHEEMAKQAAQDMIDAINNKDPEMLLKAHEALEEYHTWKKEQEEEVPQEGE